MDTVALILKFSITRFFFLEVLCQQEPEALKELPITNIQRKYGQTEHFFFFFLIKSSIK